jgi:predicted permease
MLNDVRYGIRILLKKPGFTLIAVLSLALGIGANTAIFTLLNAALLKSLPVREPEKLVLFGNAQSAGMTNGFPDQSWDLFSYPFYRKVQQRTDVFAGVTGLLSIPWGVHGTVNTNRSSGELEKIQVQLVSGTYFPVLGVNAALGRVLSDDDDQNQGAHPVAVVSYGWWAKRLGADPSVIGKTITIDSINYTIVGVAAPEFFGTSVGDAPNIWIPLSMEKQLPPAHWDGRTKHDVHSLYLIGRLKDGITVEQANAVVSLMFKQELQEMAGSQPTAVQLKKMESASVQLTSVARGLSSIRERFSQSLKVLMGVVALVLLIACANVANLLLAHGSARRREFAVRLAVGAGRIRLIRQLLTESALLVVVGAFAGVAMSWWGTRLLLSMASDGPNAVPLDVSPNIRVLGFTILTSVVCALLFGTMPALRAARIDPNSSLKSGKGTGSSAWRSPLGKVLVVAQVALSLLLLVGAGLFVRTLINLQSIPTGFDPEHVLLLQLDPSAIGYKDDDPRLAVLLRDVEDKVKLVPGVQAASFAFIVFNQGFWTGPAFTNEPVQPEGHNRSIRNNVVGLDFFDAMGLKLIQGRNFGPQDREKSQEVAVISKAMAERFFPNTNPIGKRFGIEGPKSAGKIEVIGVVTDAKFGEVTEQLRPMAYYPHAQKPGALGNFVVRYSGSPDSVVPQIRAAIKEVNHDLPIDEVLPLAEHIGRSLVTQKLVARLGLFFGLLALLLACIGLYGVMSYGVARRTNELGIRIALGAQRFNVFWLVLREGLLLVGIGVGLGLVAALLSTKLAKALLYGLQPNDPTTIAMAAVLLVVIAGVATYLPARRAARVNPMDALREE